MGRTRGSRSLGKVLKPVEKDVSHTVRLPPSLLERVKRSALATGRSINQAFVDLLSWAMDVEEGADDKKLKK